MIVDTCINAVRSLQTNGVGLTAANITSILGGGTSASGITVTRESVLSHPSIFRGVQLIAGDVAKLPLHVYRRDPDGNRERLDAHPAARLVNWRANPFLKSHAFIKAIVGNALVFGDGFGRIFRNGAGRPTEITLLDSEQTYPVQVDGGLVYQAFIDGRDTLLQPQDVFHVRGLGYDGLSGWSILEKLKDALGAGLAAQRFTSVYFKNNAQPRVVVKFPGYLGDQTAVERFRQSWGAVHGGVDNAHKPAILEGGAEIQPFQMSNSDAQLVNLRELDNRIVATILGLPSHMLNDNEKTSFASLEQENQRYLDSAIDPWLREIETESRDKLLTEDEGRTGTVFVEFTRSAFVRTNLKDRFEAYFKGIQGGFMSRAQARRLENWNVDDPALEEFLQPLNMIPAGEEPAPEPQPSQPEPERTDWKQKSLEQARHATELLVKRVGRSAENAAKKPKDFLKWLDEVEEKHLDKFVKDFRVINPMYGETVARDCLETIREGLLEASGQVHEAQLVETVTQVAASYLVDLPPVVAAELIEKGYGETCATD